jgi:hypothetical protein
MCATGLRASADRPDDDGLDTDLGLVASSAGP